MANRLEVKSKYCCLHHIFGQNSTFSNGCAKVQLILKANFQAVDSPKKRTNQFAFFDWKSCYVVKSNAVRSFFGESNFS